MCLCSASYFFVNKKGQILIMMYDRYSLEKRTCKRCCKENREKRRSSLVCFANVILNFGCNDQNDLMQSRQ